MLDPNLKGRVSEIHVSLLSDKDIKAIAKNGFKLLNINAHEELIEQIVYYSARLGSMAHQMCLDICRGIGVRRRVWKEKNIDRKSFNHAIQGLIKKNEGTLTAIYESAVKDELGWYILKTLSNNKHDKLPLREIYKIISNLIETKFNFTFTAEHFNHTNKTLSIFIYRFNCSNKTCK